ncbi:MAG: hypothetical protein RDV48_08655 [Candidatus Eremiobacteraeota bacterium]|nr:hypothetical protein [Candidatus Eremiobacteraeota bacterium]
MVTLQCRRCRTYLRRDDMFDVPRKFIEFYCMKCGERIWIDVSRFSWSVKWN